MQLTFEQKDLVQAATVVANLLKRSATTLPVLSNLLIDASGDHAVFLGTDLESMVRVRIPGKVEGGAGRITLPADKLAELAGLLPAGTDVRLEDEGGQVRLSCDSQEYKLVTLPPDDYPEWKQDDARVHLKIGQKPLRRAIDAVTYALPVKDHRRILMGALMEVVEGNLRLTATDGKKLSRIKVPAGETKGQTPVQTVVAGKLLGDVRRILGDEGSVDVQIGEKQVAFTVDNVEFRTNAIEGKYPDCDAVIPKEFPFEVRLNRDQFQLEARRAGVVSEDKTKSIILLFEDNSCSFSSMAADVGTFAGKVGVEYGGNPLELAYNYQLMIDTLNSFTHPDIHLKIKSQQAPTLFQCDEEPDHICILMPIKLAEARGTSTGG